MALHNILGLLLPLGVALTIGALAIGMFYRERTRENPHDDPYDFTADFHPGPGFDTKAAPTSEEEETCSICRENLKRFQSIRTLPCVHKFHKKCVDNWLRYEMFCPNCRTVVPS